MNYILLFIAAVIPPILIAFYLYYRDKYMKEPVKLLLKSFFLGWLIVIPIMGLHYLLDWGGIYDNIESILKTDSVWYSIFEAFIMAALIEEGLKYLAFKKGIWKSPFFDEYYDGILYAGLISLGFATLENLFYVFDYGLSTALTRALTAIPAHTFFGITMGYYFSLAKFNFTNTKRNLWLAFLVPFLLHGLYDVIVFEIARFDDPSNTWFYPVALSFWVLMIAMFIISRKHIKKLLKKDA